MISIVGMVHAFVKMPGTINPALLTFLWQQEKDKATSAAQIKIAMTEYAATINKDVQEAWMEFVIQMVELDQILDIGLIDLAKAKIREAYAEIYRGIIILTSISWQIGSLHLQRLNYVNEKHDGTQAITRSPGKSRTLALFFLHKKTAKQADSKIIIRIFVRLWRIRIS